MLQPKKSHRIPLHLDPDDSSDKANLKRIQHWERMAELNPSGFSRMHQITRESKKHKTPPINERRVDPLQANHVRHGADGARLKNTRPATVRERFNRLRELAAKAVNKFGGVGRRNKEIADAKRAKDKNHG